MPAVVTAVVVGLAATIVFTFVLVEEAVTVTATGTFGVRAYLAPIIV